jgi:perosamine synthetase
MKDDNLMEKKHIPVASPIFNGNEKKYVNDCLDSGWISSNGEYIKRFEQEFASFCGVNHAISCSNGTVALHLPLLAYGIGPGDEILVPTLTYIATANAVTYCGATPVLVDSEPSTWNISVMQLEKKITSRTKGIIVVHLYGHPVDMDPIMEVARKYNLFVIEDAAEAHGAKYKGKMIGSIGDVATFSFFGNKIITSGEGGMIVTNDNRLAQKMRLLKGQGMDPERRYWFPIVGYNYRMTNIQAAIGLAQLENIQWHLEKRKEIANFYKKYSEKLADYISVHDQQEWAEHSYWMVSILIKEEAKISRDELMEYLAGYGIETRPVFYPMHVMPPYKEEGASYPVADYISLHGVNLPTHAFITEQDVVDIMNKIETAIKQGL